MSSRQIKVQSFGKKKKKRRGNTEYRILKKLFSSPPYSFFFDPSLLLLNYLVLRFLWKYLPLTKGLIIKEYIHLSFHPFIQQIFVKCPVCKIFSYVHVYSLNELLHNYSFFIKVRFNLYIYILKLASLQFWYFFPSTRCDIPLAQFFLFSAIF